MSQIEEQRALRRQVVQVCRLLYAKNMIFASDGNVSVRWGTDYVIATPSGVHKGLLRPDDLVVTDLDGRIVSDRQNPDPKVGDEGRGKTTASQGGLLPSAELRLHLEVYRQRPDVRAVVHAHPPITTALTVAGVSLAPCILPETLVTLGQIVTTAYATPSSEQGPQVIRELIRDHDALVLDRHGAVTVGPTPLKAYMRMEKVENTAQVIQIALTLGRLQTLPVAEVRKLSAIRNEMLGPERVFAGPDCRLCGACEGL
ncbi:MAG: class II aldolase/adducin family protein [Chloroflexi bacterium]|nr:class II aldolase/adducin family protein [Chloroflexota bacterium]